MASKPAAVQQIEQLWGNKFELHPAPVHDFDPHVGLMAHKDQYPKYQLDGQSRITGLNLAATGLDDTRWEKILHLLGPDAAHLQALNLNENKLTAFPPDKNLCGLVWLDLSENGIKEFELPEGNSVLKDIRLEENPLTSPPPDVVNLGKSEVLKWLNDRNKRPVLEAKIMFIGDSGYGKTHLIEMIKNGRLIRSDITTTHGIERSRIEDIPSPSGPIRLNIWDLGGQQFMRSTHQFFFTERTLYVLVTVARRERKDLNHWLQLVHEIGADAPVLVVINKTDLDEHDIDREPLKREYPNIIDFVRTAIFDKPEKGVVALDTIRELRNKINRFVSDRKTMPSVFVEQRQEWFAVKADLEAMPEEYISFEKYRSLPHIRTLPEEEQRSNLRQLASLGTVVSFVDDPRLSDTHVINPKWIMDGVYCLINDPEVKDKQRGRFSFTDLSRLLDKKRYPSEKYPFLVDLMEKFRLCYPVKGTKNTFLLPDLFSDIEPIGVWDKKDNPMPFRFNYGNYPPDLFITQFIVERYADIVDEKRWRSGVVVSNGRCEAIVRRVFSHEFIEIQVAGPLKERRSYLHTLLEVFRDLHRPFEKLKVIREIPFEGVWLNYDHLLKYEEKEQPFYHPDLEKEIPVSLLLDGYGRPNESNWRDAVLDGLEALKIGQEKILDQGDQMLFKIDGLVFNQAAILDNLHQDRIDQKSQQEASATIEALLNELLAQKKLQPNQLKTIEKINQAPDLKSKLKWSIPLIPAILSYETEMAWDWQKAKKSLSRLIIN